MAEQSEAPSIPKKITFASVEHTHTHTSENIEPTDRLLIDPSIFEGAMQTDGDLCNYLTFTAQIHMCGKGAEQAKISQRIIKEGGIKPLAELIRKQMGQVRLTNWEARDEFAKRVPGVTALHGLSGYKLQNENAGEAIVRMIDEDQMIPSILIQNENHAVLGIGVSGNGQEILVWDALRGTGNPRLRRIPIDNDQIGVMLAAKVNPVFQARKT